MSDDKNLRQIIEDLLGKNALNIMFKKYIDDLMARCLLFGHLGEIEERVFIVIKDNNAYMYKKGG